MIACARLNISTAPLRLQQQLTDFSISWRDHFNKMNYSGSWTAFPLRTPGGADTIIPEANVSGDKAYRDHENMSYFPQIKAFIDTLQCDVLSVRLLNLSAGSVIREHRDNELAFEKGEMRLHVPLLTNPQVEFYVNNERVIMNGGECWYINANLPHRVANHGETDRIHLVMDCRVNHWLTDVMQAASVKREVPDHTPEQLLLMIRSLRTHNTETSDRMADKFQAEYDLLTLQQ